jgi:AraC-like DNA-binding protein
MAQDSAPIALARDLACVENSRSPVICRATNYPAGWRVPPHEHTKHQLIHALHGVMVVHANSGQWVVPPSRGLWMPAGMTHSIHCIGDVQMRSLYVQQDAAPLLFAGCQVVGISSLMRELIRAAVDVVHPYRPDSRDGRLMQLLLDELRALPLLPLHLPMPTDRRILGICQSLQERADDASTLADWAERLQLNVKTIQRLFATQTGMTFGQWRQQARLLKALELLACGERIIDIALSLGYESPSAFSTMFRKHFGQMPSRFFDAR